MELKTRELDRKAIEDQFWQDGVKIDNMTKVEKEFIIGLARWEVNSVGSSQGTFPGPWVLLELKDMEKVMRIIGTWNALAEENSNPQVRWIIRPQFNPQLIPSWHDIKSLDPEQIRENAMKLGKWLQKLPVDFEWWD